MGGVQKVGILGVPVHTKWLARFCAELLNCLSDFSNDLVVFIHTRICLLSDRINTAASICHDLMSLESFV